MASTLIDEVTDRPTEHVRTGALAGTGTLICFNLRRDRIKLAAWLLGTTLTLAYFGTALKGLTETAEQRQDISRFMEGGLGAVFGPGYGRADPTVEVYVVGVYGLIFFLLAALMSMQLVVRHTRAEEQSGRAELIGSSVLGRHARLSAALVVAMGANAILALLLGAAMVANDFDGGDGVLFGVSVGAVGLVFAGIAAIAVQLTEYSRAANGIAGAVFGVAWAVRAGGDMADDYGSPLSWLSPLAWSNQTRPYTDGRWWPLLLTFVLSAVLVMVGYALSARRDIGAGLVPPRLGRSSAAAWLRTPLSVAFRLQRAGLIWWTVALASFGFVFGGLTGQVADPTDISADRIDMFGGSLETLADGYLGVITLFSAALAAVVVVGAVRSVRSEETTGRAEPVLATATSRPVWFGSHLAVTVAGLIVLLLVVGVATGIGAALSEGDVSYIGSVAGAHLVHAPGVLVVGGFAVLLCGLAPRAIGVTWVWLGVSIYVGIFGTFMDIPIAIRNLSPIEHTGQPPLDGVAAPAALIQMVIAVTLSAVGVVAFRRRDLDTK